MKNIYLLLIVALFFAACQKQPTANFNTDKTTYTAGDVMHLTDASSNAYSWLWTTPDGNTYTTQNLDFPTDSEDIGGNKTFILEVFSKNGSKNSSTSKSITLNQNILPTDYCSAISGIQFKYQGGASGVWGISAGKHYSIMNTVGSQTVGIDFGNGSTKPPAGVYQIVNSKSVLAMGKAYIEYGGGDAETGFYNYFSINGQVTVTQAYHSKINIAFSSVKVQSTTSTSDTFRINGNITSR